LVAGNLPTGLSIGWWADKHHRHHANPNKEDHDPDIGEGVLAFTTAQAATRTGRLARIITAYQAVMFSLLLTLEGPEHARGQPALAGAHAPRSSAASRSWCT
jgi:fatty acid desaturase